MIDPTAQKSIDDALAHEREFLKSRHAGEEQPPIGICMSGGGIRSAIFNLGILTVLEEKGFLKKADYLSTVSGGGYIGGYVMANRVNGHEVKGDKDDPPLKHLRGYANYLTPSLGAFSADTWTMMMVWFRNTSLLQVFLLTVFGFLLMLPRYWGLILRENINAEWITEHAVTTAIGLFHLFVVGAACMLIQSFPTPGSKRTVDKEDKGKNTPEKLTQHLYKFLFGIIVVALVGSTFFALGAFRPFATGDTAELRLQFGLTLGSCGFYLALFSLGFGRQLVNKGLAAALAVIFVVASTIICAGEFELHGYDALERASMSAGLAAMILLIARNRAFYVEDHEKGKDLARALLAGAVCGAVSVIGLTVSAAFHGDAARNATLLAQHPLVFASSKDLWNYALFAPPGLLATLGCCIIVLIGIAGRAMPDIVREGWSRLGALLYMKSVAMLVIGVIGIYGPMLILWAWVSWDNYVLASGGVATAIVGALSIFAANSGDTDGKKGGFNGKELVAKLGPIGFIVTLFCAVAMIIHATFIYNALNAGSAACEKIPGTAKFAVCSTCVGLGEPATSVSVAKKFADCPGCASGANWNGPAWPSAKELSDFHWQFMDTAIRDQWALVPAFTFGLAALALFLMFRLDINEFSISRFYRNRLTRCFLGAGRYQTRKPDPVTGFDREDDLPMKTIAAHLKRSPGTPIPIVNTALNAMGGQDAAMQERRAQSFAFTPFHAYSNATGAFDMTKLMSCLR